MRVSDGIDLGPGSVNRRVDHRFARRIFELGNRPLVSRSSVVLLAYFHVFVDIHEDDIFARNIAERSKHGFDKKLSRTRNARAHMAVIVRQSLGEHDAVAERNFSLQFHPILLAGIHVDSPFQI